MWFLKPKKEARIKTVYDTGHSRVIFTEDGKHFFVDAHANIYDEPYVFDGKHWGVKSLDDLGLYISCHASSESKAMWIKMFPHIEEHINKGDAERKESNRQSVIHRLTYRKEQLEYDIPMFEKNGMYAIMPEAYANMKKELAEILEKLKQG